jgi:hypothetical protein
VSPAPTPPGATRSARAGVAHAPAASKAPKPSKRGRFHRPELESGWERFSRNRAVQAISGTVLLAGTAALVVVALGR